MFPDQAREWKMRRMTPQPIVLDSDVLHVEGSIKAAEKITGGKFPNPTDFKEEIKVITPWVPAPEEDVKSK